MGKSINVVITSPDLIKQQTTSSETQNELRSANSSVSFVIPCLNEQYTLAEVLTKINRVCATDFKGRRTEVIVSDNGSTDNSVKIAKEHGARVVHCDKKGYGAAILFGLQNANCEAVVFADADNTYDFLETPRLVHELDKGFDLVVGSRIQGEIHNGAMPFLHRYIGTPILNFFINLLYARKDNRISDCNSGFRCFKRKSFISWQIKSSGMEFASEMLIKALKANAAVSHVPISLYPDRRGRIPHLKRWRDGMRHLLQIFLDSPESFYTAGSIVFCISWLIIILGLLFGPIQIGFAHIFGLHSMMFALLGSIFGIIIWTIGLFLSIRIKSNIRLYRYLLGLSEDKLFWYSVEIVFASGAFLLAIFVYWGFKGFEFISIEKLTLGLVSLASNGVLFVSNLITAHLLKRT